MKNTSVHLRDEQAEAIEEIAQESRTDPDFPDLSLSEAHRRLLDEGLESSDGDLSGLVSEERRILLVRERRKKNEWKLRNLRTGFETRVKDNFKRRFENGYSAEQLERFAVSMKQEARDLWPEWTDDDHSERRSEVLAYIDRVVDAARDAAERSEFDPLDPEEIFGGYEGVEAGERRRETADKRRDVDMDALASEARRRLDAGTRHDPDAVVDALATDRDLPSELAEEAVDAALDADRDADSGVADD